MGYSSKSGRRPAEYASKATHQEIIKDPAVQDFLKNCKLPAEEPTSEKDLADSVDIREQAQNPIKHIVAIDGGYTEVAVRAEFPSSRIAFFQFGALFFETEVLKELGESEFLFPEQMAKMKNIQRLKLALPTKGVVAFNSKTLTHSIRATLNRFFSNEPSDQPLLESLKWFLFEEYSETPVPAWVLANCPVCERSGVPIQREQVRADGTFDCAHCGSTLYLIDVFRLHEAVDDELGGSGILGYVTTLIEQLLIVYLIKLILETRPALLHELLFLKDGPLAFFGQTANLHKPMRRLVRWLESKHNIYLVGAEKSGAFVEHADAISKIMKPGTALILSNDYIYKYIIPGIPDPLRPYGATTYYSSKVILKTALNRMYVLTVPSKEPLANPKAADLKNLAVIANNVELLRCDMYDSALVPIALVNHLVSLADHPSTKLIEKFAKANINSH